MMSALQSVSANPAVSSPEIKSAVFTALSDPIRRAMIERLAAEGPMNVGELSIPFAVSAPAISRHLKVLETAGIVKRAVNRQWRVCNLEIASLVAARAWLDTVLPANDQ